MAVGMRACAAPIVIVTLAVMGSYRVGNSAFDDQFHEGGLFGTAVATMGMLSTVVFVLAMDVFGPITDNAGGIVEMSEQPAHVRDITDTLDAVGNTTKAITKGFSVGSASLACFLLFSAFMDEVSEIAGKKFDSVNLVIPEVFLGGFLGATLVMYFAGQCMTAVGTAAQEVVKEVRQQFRERPGIMDYTQQPDHERCVRIVTYAALREMTYPGLIATVVPLATGIGFRLASGARDPLIGAKAIAGFLMFATSTGVLMAIFLNTAGGAWDNAKKYIERGALGGKGSEAHKAAVTGDTVGDPCKDTAGPSLHVLIKLLSTTTLVCAPLFVAEHHDLPGPITYE
jgi:inorganic pyrophosphatase